MLVLGTQFLSMMKTYNESVEIIHNIDWPYIPDHPHRILIIVV